MRDALGVQVVRARLVVSSDGRNVCCTMPSGLYALQRACVHVVLHSR